MSINDVRRRVSKRLSINDIADNDSPHVYVMNRAILLTKKPSTLLLPHRSGTSGDVKSLDLPMTTNPIDLSELAPKDELIRNGELLRMISRGLLELVDDEDAEAILDTPEGRAEQERLMADRMRAFSTEAPPGSRDDENFKAQLPPDVLQKGAPGDVDTSAQGVTPSVMDAFANVDGEHRLAVLRNLAPIMTDFDKRYIRAHTSDEAVRNLVGR